MSRISTRAVRVVVVDDDADIRGLVRATLNIDETFEVVGEAANGQEAIDLVSSTDVDLVVLDRDMPVMDGLTALPILHEVAPGLAVVLYTARSDAESRQAAIAAGAVEVVDKVSVGMSFLQRLASALVSHWTDGESVDLRVGPLPSRAAELWVENSARILDAATTPGSPVHVAVDPEDEATLRDLLQTWHQIALTEPTFYWQASASVAAVDRAVRAWAALDDLSTEAIESVGLTWSPPEAQEFFEALTSAVVEAIARHDEMRQLASSLSHRWLEG